MTIVFACLLVGCSCLWHDHHVLRDCLLVAPSKTFVECVLVCVGFVSSLRKPRGLQMTPYVVDSGKQGHDNIA